MEIDICGGILATSIGHFNTQEVVRSQPPKTPRSESVSEREKEAEKVFRERSPSFIYIGSPLFKTPGKRPSIRAGQNVRGFATGKSVVDRS